jgi:hypothetical protein
LSGSPLEQGTLPSKHAHERIPKTARCSRRVPGGHWASGIDIELSGMRVDESHVFLLGWQGGKHGDELRDINHGGEASSVEEREDAIRGS